MSAYKLILIIALAVFSIVGLLAMLGEYAVLKGIESGVF